MDVEEYFQVEAFASSIPADSWPERPSRVAIGTRRVLDLLERHATQATFFVVGWVAERQPGLVREIRERGHEIACHGYWHKAIYRMTPAEFREDLRRARATIEEAAGVAVRGYRAPTWSITRKTLWALDILAEEGFAYDSSFYPRLRGVAAEPWRRFAFRHRFGDAELIELPLATLDWRGWSVPIAGGAYLRQLPHGLMSRALDHWHRSVPSPLVMYFHVWELDAELPKITAAPWYARLRQYRNLERMPSLLRYYLSRYPFEPIRQHLRLDPKPATPRVALREGASVATQGSELPRTPVTIVVPCFNEETVLPYLENTLRRVAAELGALYELHYVFVDDGSTDGTRAALEARFGARPNHRVVPHERNSGVAAAILTGIRSATTEVVCSIDCDCTYDPLQLRELIPLLQEGVAVVTASPYHPSGRVLNVPPWRLGLSKGLSALYRRVFRQKLHTYTSCFRVYRRSTVSDLRLREGGFLGVAEMLGVLDLEGKRIVEQPAVLEVRLLGHSKMKLARTIRGHLRLLARLAALRWLPSRGAVVPSIPQGAARGSGDT